ncbi:MAG: SDR family NAD(P)-dependent oxidoreductase [Myxococcales bacterium]|nr:SDR family NAD(P)-dependent oxidoreductase [Myxococcales bacterium]
MRSFQDRVAVITGAGSGIGRALARNLAAQGCHLALSDINEETLGETRDMIQETGIKVTADRVDVASRDQLYAWAAEVERAHGAAHLLFNNAGVAVASSLRRVTDEDFEWLMNINFWGVVHGTRAFLPLLARQDAAHITNVSSIFGIIAVPMNGVYNAAKFAVRGFTEALRMELELDGLPIGVTCVHPGGIKTNIARSSRYNEDDSTQSHDELADEFERRLARTTPERCAQIILDAVRRNAPRVLVGADARLIDRIQRLLPTGYQKLATKFARRTWRRPADG